MDSQEYYNQYATQYFENSVNLDVSHLIEPFMEHLEEGSAVLDLGCGSGRDCLTFLDAGYDVTALDGSSEMCALAEIHTDLEVLNMYYEELDFEEVFDGIWALASLVHIEKSLLPTILKKVSSALNNEGIFFASFHKGTSTEIRDQRFFCEYSEDELVSLIKLFPEFSILSLWETTETRTDGIKREWLNLLLRKQ
ncbi:MAG: class I SAM-dependent methyltransferase [Lachnospiraceae bacterium]|nr:class I SAM-dependent methyltransferase [Lachnospiraceae bacterium]